MKNVIRSILPSGKKPLLNILCDGHHRGVTDFPGWHLECSAMSTKYLGEVFDIHGGGMDLQFPHHECEIAQSTAALGKESVRYWMHNNMITINGQKMARSLGNFITLDQLFTGDHPLLQQAYSPMTIRFFLLAGSLPQYD